MQQLDVTDHAIPRAVSTQHRLNVRGLRCNLVTVVGVIQRGDQRGGALSLIVHD